MTVPTGELVCRLVQEAAGRPPRELEFVGDADRRKGWLVRAWLDDGSRRDYRLTVDDGGRLNESAFDCWPPKEIRGGIRRCRC